MTPQSPPPPPRTVLGKITQAFQAAQAQVDFSKLALKKGARNATLQVTTGDQEAVYPLLGEHYILGRSSQQSDIVVRSPIVSQVHVTLTRDRNLPGEPFVLKDRDSTNGVYRGKKKLKKTILNHGDLITLGPPELTDAVTLRYIDPPPWYVQTARYGLYGFTGLSLAVGTWIVALEWPKIPIRPLPESVQGPVVIYAQEDGQSIPLRQQVTQAHREQARISDFSPYLPRAVMASEDSRYNWHLGVDPIGTLRAALANVRGGEILEGGSTITQQLARSIYREYVGTEDSAARKIREAVVALKLETFYSKDDLMRLYLNRVFLGNNLYGFEDAARFYFDKSSADLNLSEAATLVGILPAPNAFNPVQDYEAAVDFRDRVLTRMVTLGMVSQEEARRARRTRIEISPKAREQLQSTRAPFFYSYVFDELDQVLGSSLAREGNFIVLTSLNLDMQAEAEATLREAVATAGQEQAFTEGAIVTLDTTSGAIQALVGGVDYQTSQFNRASQALRQPGSTFKVFAYASALEQGASPGQTYSCSNLVSGGQEFQGCRSGSGALDMYAAMARSENVVAIRIAEEAGLGNVIQTAERLGIESELNPTPGLVLGESEVTPLEITGSFAAIANNGIWNRPHGVMQVLDSSDCINPQDFSTCRVIYEFGQAGDGQIEALPAPVASTLVGLLQGVVQGGTGRSAFLGLGEGGKTGTTNDNRDLWFIGFVPGYNLTTGVWLGNDDNSSTDGSSGQAAAVWGNYMRQIVR
ncbi:transglycosylase domain-containing protein [Pseudanabaena sp. FACHB-2040]|uniref:transglycosylase domain-containing protein n=1 Tax=Pseudanabaena sp. FACHB-2040 TaxID=2692859 RepID=UPI0016842951|nr:transglycosylase domain-containing protein [Pseudanabaena sp. FACHB-2040]MBD2259703.1 transglycosylase domain-containing protein [Pseudanabaena sp. FACHB-2040]